LLNFKKLTIKKILIVTSPKNFAYFPTYFASKSSAHFKKILRYKPASLHTVQLEVLLTYKNLINTVKCWNGY